MVREETGNSKQYNLVWQHLFSRIIVFQNLSISIDGQQILQFLKNIDFLSFDKTTEVSDKWQFFQFSLVCTDCYVVACILSYTHESACANGHRMHSALHWHVFS